MAEKVILVDSNDCAIGEMEKMEAHKTAQLHRAVSVFLFNSEGKLLLQKRAMSKYHSPGLWTNTACTHPKSDESVAQAAQRRLNEEMGIKGVTVSKIFDFVYKEALGNGLTEYEFDHVYVGVSDDVPIPEPTEVCDYVYVDCDKLLVQIQKEPENYTVWFKKIIQRVISELQLIECENL